MNTSPPTQRRRPTSPATPEASPPEAPALRPVEPPEDPTPADWARSARSANALLVIELARQCGLIAGGPAVDVKGAAGIVREARAAGVVVPVRSLYRVLEDLDVSDLDASMIDDGETAPVIPCGRCNGCGRIADAPTGEPWTFWEELPEPSKLAIRLGIVRPIACPECDGAGVMTVSTNTGNTVEER